jgi:type 1 fimbria pilin
MAASNTCTSPGPLSFTHHVGNVYVPRDAAVGTTIGRARQFVATSNNESSFIECDNDGSVRLASNILATTPFHPGLLRGASMRQSPQAILSTNIPGVGVQFTLGFPFDGFAQNAFNPDFGDGTVPFTAHHEKAMGSTLLSFTRLESYITLIKTADIAPGPQTLDGRELFSGTFTGIPGKAFGVGLTGTVTQAHCGSSKVSADPVPLGDWNKDDFTGPGYVTAAVPFNITLSSCIADDLNINIATATIHLDGAGGSMPVTPAIPGVFSLTTDSTAKGIGIQILKGDGMTPVALSTEVPLQRITSGDTVLDFTARYYQTDASRDVMPGDAKGALFFTITYQ